MSDVELKKQLTKIKNDLFFIDRFSEKTNFNINRELAEINARVEKNNALIETYKESTRTPPKNQTQRNKNVDMVVDILSHNSTVIEKKVNLMELHLKEIYDKIELLGKSVTSLCSVVQNTLDEEIGA